MGGTQMLIQSRDLTPLGRSCRARRMWFAAPRAKQPHGSKVELETTEPESSETKGIERRRDRSVVEEVE